MLFNPIDRTAVSPPGSLPRKFFGGFPWEMLDGNPRIDYLGFSQQELTPGTETAMTMTNRELVIETLHHNGSLKNRLTERQIIQVRRFADGFGPIFRESPKKWSEETRACFWDWSAVRDSSEGAIETMAAIIRERLK